MRLSDGFNRTIALENPEDLVACGIVSHVPRISTCVVRTGNDLHLRDTMAVAENDTDLRWSSALLRELADLVNDLIGCGLEPGWGGARVWDGGARYALRFISEHPQSRRDSAYLAVGVKTTHLDGGL